MEKHGFVTGNYLSYEHSIGKNFNNEYSLSETCEINLPL